MKLLNPKNIILIISIASLSLVSLLKFGFFDNKIRVAPLQLEGKVIKFPYTDENKNETLIIKTDNEIYEGESSADIYVSITNKTKNPEKAVVLFYFPKTPEGESGPQLETLEQRIENDWQLLNLFKSNIKINEELLKNALKKRELIPDQQEIKGGSQIEIAPNQTGYLKLKISFPVGSKGEFWVEAIGQAGGYGLLDPAYISRTTTSSDATPGWYNAGANNWTYRKKITLDKSKVSGTSNLSNFPVLISRTDLDFRHTSFGGNVASSSAGVTGGGGDFVFTSSDGTTKLDHEIEKYASSSGELWAWVEVPTLSVSADTVLYLYYGGPSTGATNQNKTGVWDTNYVAVWHLKEDPGATCSGTQEACDSTSNNNHLDALNMEAGDTRAGKIGRAIDFDGVDEKLQKAVVSTAISNVTLQAWVFSEAAPGGRSDIIYNGNTAADGYCISVSDGACGTGEELNVLNANVTCDAVNSTTNLSRNSWKFVTATRDTTTWRLYLDGVLIHSGDSAPFTPTGNTDINNGQRIDGSIDEVRVSNSVRSADWIKTEYNNQNSPRTFAAFGGQDSRTGQ